MKTSSSNAASKFVMGLLLLICAEYAPAQTTNTSTNYDIVTNDKGTIVTTVNKDAFSSGRQIPLIFPRSGDLSMDDLLAALNINIGSPQPASATLTISNATLTNPDLRHTIGRLSMLAAEVYYWNKGPITPAQVISNIRSTTNPSVKRTIQSILSTLVMLEIRNPIDPGTVALKTWSADLFKNFKIRMAKSILNEYQKWKTNPCLYAATGYTPPAACATNTLNISQWVSTTLPPQNVLASAGIKSTFGDAGTLPNINNAVVAINSTSKQALELATIPVSSSYQTAAMAYYDSTSQNLKVLTAAVTKADSSKTTYSTDLSSGATFITSTGTTSTQTSTATTTSQATIATVGSTGWPWVVAVPTNATIYSYIMGSNAGYSGIEPLKVETLLKGRLSFVMNETIDFKQVLSAKNGIDMFFSALMEAAQRGLQIIPANANGEIRFYSTAGYPSKFELSYLQSGVNQILSTPELISGNEKLLAIPYNATNIKIRGQYLNGTWLTLFTTTLPNPAYACYATTGTVTSPGSSTDCFLPVTTTTATTTTTTTATSTSGSLTVTHGGGYSAWVTLTYTSNGSSLVAQDQKGFTLGWNKVYTIPKDATNIRLLVKEATGLLWEPWKTIIDKTWPAPATACIKIYGTTLDPKWNNECK